MINLKACELVAMDNNQLFASKILADAHNDVVYYDPEGTILSGLGAGSKVSTMYPETIADQLQNCVKSQPNLIFVNTLLIHRALVCWADSLPISDANDGGWAVLFFSSDNLMSEVARLMPFGFLHINKYLHATYCNEVAHRILGTQDSDMLNRGWLEQFGDSILPALKAYTDEIALHSEPLSLSLKVTTPLGREKTLTLQVFLYPHNGSGAYSLYMLLYDLSDTGLLRADLTKAIEQDNLTGLLNRAAFLKRIKDFTRPEFEYAAYVFIDLNDFKGINDTYGHKIGDKVLENVARKLMSVTKGRELISRFGGDEFVLCFPDKKDLTEIYNLGRKLVSVVNSSMFIFGQKLDIQCSIGICWMPALSELRNLNNEARVERALDAADQCMYLVKKHQSGNKAFKVYDPSLKNLLFVQKNKQQEFNRILQEECICIHFQPIFNDNGKISSIEALARLTKELTLHSHIGDVIESANEGGEELALFHITTVKTLEEFGRIRPSLGDINLNINIDISQLEQLSFSTWLSEQCLENRVPFSNVSIEITELLLESDSVQVTKNLNHLLEMGFFISMDDFGTGYSSLKRLLEYQFHELKVDRYFVEHLIGSDKYTKMVTAMVGMGNALNLNLLAEGIETPEQLELCKALGFTLFQGFHLAKPMSPKALIAFLKEYNTEQ
ncbi:bifunctional diguanylate cyclase/phosphodiesterase [Aestuariibacter sp. GS-14]|uniref:bifunctional diguanylate cyclase/phosphodiesterase n=1 Tax=Aestuariibacter sp. GS-14 TaxID=2590670 RepID=UPI00112B6D2D|nr:bifunctional diguanylate cyclase/phosphodiesterase [Aestuariibacter sp. GS-14]TPV56500.1 bifunctional diguanylate cyclase/phosphodiesterase [Aestuariibacter sp. GS-14]